MANRVIIDRKSPLQWYLDDPAEDPQYVSRHIDDWLFSATILPWQQRVCFNLPMHTADIVSQQLQSSYGPINLILCRKEDDSIVDTIPFEQVAQNENDTEVWIYEADVQMNAYQPGLYYFRMKFGNPVILSLRSENIILSEKIENTLLLEYSHYRFLGDMIFETGYTAQLRVPGIIRYEGPESKDTVYEDQELDIEVIDTVPFDLWQLRLGLATGIPDYLARKIAKVLACSSLKIDGRFYVRPEGEKMERITQPNYPMSAWTINLREQLNRSGRTYDNDEPQDGFLTVMINTDSKGFGADNGGNESLITDIT